MDDAAIPMPASTSPPPPDLSQVRSLADLFGLLPSPAPVIREPAGEGDYVAETVAALLQYDQPELRTTLHSYQRKTVAYMLQCEYDRLDDGSGARDPLRAMRGGILCEEMGTGKTLECLALILATRGSVPQALNESKVAQQIKYHNSDEDVASDHRRTLPSLTALCIKQVRSTAYPIPWWEEPVLQRHTSLMSRVQTSAPYFTKITQQTNRHATLSRSTGGDDVRTDVFLSYATLVVVPSTLLGHWLEEIRKHVHPDSLRVLVIDRANQIPSAMRLANEWDLVLLSYDHFSREADFLLPRPSTSSKRQCRCRYVGSSRTVQCQCPPEVVEQTPLLGCRFKRLIVDEGNALAGQSRLVDLAAQLNAENRWIVSGTPTETLVGAGDQDWSAIEQAKTPHSSPPRKQANRSDDIICLAPRPSAWSKEERKDLDDRIFRLLVHFLHLAPYYDVSMLDYGFEPTQAARKNWTTNVVKPLFPANGGPPPMAPLESLYSILSRCMVRNRPEDVAQAKPLPPLRRHYVALHLSTLERKTFNVIQALISANAVLSEQTDEDYFFHPSNRKWLLEIIGNLWLACFHFASPDRLEHADEAVKLITKKLDTDYWKGNAALQHALDHLRSAMTDTQWVRQNQDVDYHIHKMPEGIRLAWRRQTAVRGWRRLTAAELFDLQDGMDTLLSERARKGQQLREGDEDAEEELSEDLITLGEKRKREFWQSQNKASVRRQAATKKPKGKVGTHDDAIPAAAAASINGGPDHVPGKNSTKRKRRDSHSTATKAPLPYSSRLADPLLAKSTSTKLNALISLLCTADPIPTLIFSSLSNTLYEVSFLCDILARSYPQHFSHRIFASGVAQKRLDEYITLFKTGTINLLLLKTDRGGRGLDLHRAKRVIFLEPEMRGGLERQAVKRAWRQGQESPVDAYYFYVRGTFEEQMMFKMQQRHGAVAASKDEEAELATTPSSSSSSSSSSEGSIASMLRDPVMREFVAHPRYIEAPSSADVQRDRVDWPHAAAGDDANAWSLSLFAGHAGETKMREALVALRSADPPPPMNGAHEQPIAIADDSDDEEGGSSAATSPPSVETSLSSVGVTESAITVPSPEAAESRSHTPPPAWTGKVEEEGDAPKPPRNDAATEDDRMPPRNVKLEPEPESARTYSATSGRPSPAFDDADPEPKRVKFA